MSWRGAIYNLAIKKNMPSIQIHSGLHVNSSHWPAKASLRMWIRWRRCPMILKYLCLMPFPPSKSKPRVVKLHCKKKTYQFVSQKQHVFNNSCITQLLNPPARTLPPKHLPDAMGHCRTISMAMVLTTQRVVSFKHQKFLPPRRRPPRKLRSYRLNNQHWSLLQSLVWIWWIFRHRTLKTTHRNRIPPHWSLIHGSQQRLLQGYQYFRTPSELTRVCTL